VAPHSSRRYPLADLPGLLDRLDLAFGRHPLQTGLSLSGSFSAEKTGIANSAFQQIAHRLCYCYSVFGGYTGKKLAESHERLKVKKLSVLLCLSAAVLIIVTRPKRNHPSETTSTEEDCSWLNHGGFPTKGFDGH
jgi:hypothetical protein